MVDYIVTLVVQVVHHRNNTLILSPYLVPGNSDVIVMSLRYPNVDWGIFTLKTICVKKFRDVKFSRFHLFRAIFYSL